MVNLNWKLNESGMKNNAKICQAVSDLIKTNLDWKHPIDLVGDVPLKLSSFTTEYPLWDGFTGASGGRPGRDFFVDMDNGTIMTCHCPMYQDVHMELGGIYGRNAFCIRKLTRYCNFDDDDVFEKLNPLSEAVDEYLKGKGWKLCE
jgi:hypothetical protein